MQGGDHGSFIRFYQGGWLVVSLELVFAVKTLLQVDAGEFPAGGFYHKLPAAVFYELTSLYLFAVFAAFAGVFFVQHGFYLPDRSVIVTLNKYRGTGAKSDTAAGSVALEDVCCVAVPVCGSKKVVKVVALVILEH